MTNSINFFLVTLLAIFLSIPRAYGANQVYQICSNQTFPSQSKFEKNLNTVLHDLKSETAKTGFNLSSAGESLDQVFGLTQCQGDVSNADCKTCISTATSDIRDLCPTAITAFIWYDECFLRYSNAEISNRFNFNDGATFPSTGEASDADAFFTNAKSLFTKLSQDAYISPKYFATGETTYDNTHKIYGSIDCSRDLISYYCKFCMDSLVLLLTSENTGNGTAGRIITASCTLRYDTFSFYKETNY